MYFLFMKHSLMKVFIGFKIQLPLLTFISVLKALRLRSQMTVLSSESDSIAWGRYMLWYTLTVCYVLVSNKTYLTAESKCKYAPMQFHFFLNRKRNCTLCDVYHTFWQLCPVLDYNGSSTRQPSNAYRIHLQQGKSSDNICCLTRVKRIDIFLNHFHNGKLPSSYFMLTPSVANVTKLGPENISGQRIIYHIYQLSDCCLRSGNCLIYDTP